MSDTHASPGPAADAGEQVDDGFTAEERAAFSEMQQAPEPPADGAPKVPAEGGAADAPVDGAAAPAAGAEAEVAGPDDEDEDAEGDAGAPVLGADGKPAVGADGKPAVRVKKRVSFSKFQREETARKTAEEKVRAAEIREAKLGERMAIINEAIQPVKEPVKTAAEADPEPDKEADLFAWLDWKKRDDGRRDERMTKLETERAAETEERNLTSAYNEDAAAFLAEEPNFGPAYNFLMNNRVFELAEYFFGRDLSVAGAKLSPAEIKKIQATISQEERELVKQAIASDQRPAERIYRLAKARGYRPKAPPTAEEAAAAAAAAAAGGGADPAKPGNGGAAPANGKAAIPGSLAAEPGAAAPGNVTEEIDRIKAGTAAGKSLSSGGGAPATPMTPQKLLSMTDEQFAQFVENSTPEELQAMFGA